jgi:hypothetical protein
MRRENMGTMGIYLERLIDERNRIPLLVGINAVAALVGVTSYLASLPPWFSLATVLLGLLLAPIWLQLLETARHRRPTIKGGPSTSSQQTDPALASLGERMESAQARC